MKIGIAGGGISGLTFMNFAQKLGLDAVLFEKKRDLLEQGSGIMLGINAMKILGDIGAAEEILEKGEKLDVICLADSQGKILSVTDLRRVRMNTGLETACIQRSDLHRLLASRLPEGSLRTGEPVVGLQKNTPDGRPQFILESGVSESFDLLVGADGVHSSVRESIFGSAKLRYSGYTCWRFITDMPVEAPPRSAWELIGKGTRFGIMPLGHGKVYCYATRNAPPGSYPYPVSKEEFARLFADYGFLVPAILENLLNDPERSLIHRDLADLARVYIASPEQNLIFAGDAGHATTPNLGQGAAMGIEDAAIFAILAKTETSIQGIIRKYAAARTRRVETIRSRSLWLGRLNQLESPILRLFRNTAMRLTPGILTEKALVKLFMAYENPIVQPT